MEENFRLEVMKSGISVDRKTGRVAEKIRSIAKREFGETSGNVRTAGRRETWWWNKEVQEK